MSFLKLPFTSNGTVWLSFMHILFVSENIMYFSIEYMNVEPDVASSVRDTHAQTQISHIWHYNNVIPIVTVDSIYSVYLNSCQPRRALEELLCWHCSFQTINKSFRKGNYTIHRSVPIRYALYYNFQFFHSNKTQNQLEYSLYKANLCSFRLFHYIWWWSKAARILEYCTSA